MAIIVKMRRQKAVYWSPGSINRFGRASMNDPVEIDCRWEASRVMFLNLQGEEQMSEAVVFVDRDVEVSGMLWLGVLGDAPNDPTLDNDAFEISKQDKLPDLKVRRFLRTTFLSRSRA